MTDFFLTIYRSPLPRIRFWILTMVIIWCVLTLVFSRIRILKTSWCIMNSAACAAGLLLIVWLTVLRRSPGERIVYAIPFYAFYLAKRQPEMYRELLMNVFLFVPVGLTLPYAMEVAALLHMQRRKKRENKNGSSNMYKKSASKSISNGSRYADRAYEQSDQGRMNILRKLETQGSSHFSDRLKIIGYSILFAAVFSFCIEFLQGLFALGAAEVDDVIMNTLGTAIGCCPFLVRLNGMKDP